MRGEIGTDCFSPLLCQLGAWSVTLFSNFHPFFPTVRYLELQLTPCRVAVTEGSSCPFLSPGVLQVPLPAVPRVASEQSAGDPPHPKICQRPLHPAGPAGPAAPQKELQGDNCVIWGGAVH